MAQKCLQEEARPGWQRQSVFHYHSWKGSSFGSHLDRTDDCGPYKKHGSVTDMESNSSELIVKMVMLIKPGIVLMSLARRREIKRII